MLDIHSFKMNNRVHIQVNNRVFNRVINNVCSAVQGQIHSFSVHIQIMFILHSVVFSSIVAESKRLKVRVYVCG